MKTNKNNMILTSFVPKNRHSGFAGIFHGGLHTVIFDCVSEWVCVVFLRTMAITASSEVRFHLPAMTDSPVYAIGHLHKVDGRNVYVHSLLCNSKDQLISTCAMHFVVMSESMEDRVLGKDKMPGFRTAVAMVPPSLLSSTSAQITNHYTKYAKNTTTTKTTKTTETTDPSTRTIKSNL